MTADRFYVLSTAPRQPLSWSVAKVFHSQAEAESYVEAQPARGFPYNRRLFVVTTDPNQYQ